MSVRERIAGFGGGNINANTKASSRPSWASQRAGDSAASRRPTAPASNFSASPPACRSGKLNVPDVFKNASKPANTPQPTPSSDWGATSSDKGVQKPTTSSQASNAISEGPVTTRSSALASTGDRGASVTARSTMASSQRNLESSTAMPRGATSGRVKRDLLGLSSPSASDGRSSGLEQERGDGAKSGSGGIITVGDTGRPRKTGQAGPRKLQVAGRGKAAISAEKQRAALGLDKDKDKDNGDAKIGAGATIAKTSQASTHRGPGDSGSTAAKLPAASSSSSVERGSLAKTLEARGAKSEAAVPSASSLRSSGHNLW